VIVSSVIGQLWSTKGKGETLGTGGGNHVDIYAENSRNEGDPPN